jgi:hypothetical protein
LLDYEKHALIELQAIIRQAIFDKQIQIDTAQDNSSLDLREPDTAIGYLVP